MMLRRATLLVFSLLVQLGCASLEQSSASLQRAENRNPRLKVDLPIPTAVSARSGAYRAVPLVWDPIPEGKVTGYGIERAETRDGPFAEIAQLSGRGNLFYLDEGQANGFADAETHFYRVRALDAGGRRAKQASPVVVATTAKAPAAPRALRAYSQHPRQVPLTWQASEDPQTRGYVVDRSPSRIGPYQRIAETHSRQQTAYLDRDLRNLAVFYYRVSSVNQDGTAGEPSPSVQAITKAEPLPPLGLRLSEQRLGANTLVWKPNVERDLEGYRVMRLAQGGVPKAIATLPADATTVVDSGVSSGEALRYWAVAIDQDGLESQPSPPLEVRGQDYGLRVEETPNGVSLQWRSRGGEGYRGARIERRRGLFEQKSFRAQENRFLDEDVTAGDRYEYVVTLEFPDGIQGPPSRPVEIQISPLP